MSDVSIISIDYQHGGAVPKKRQITFSGIPITIEDEKGDVRTGKDHNGRHWAHKMAAPYGFIKGTLSHDGDEIDCLVGPDRRSDKVYIIDQLHHQTGEFDESKVFLGFDKRKQVLKTYRESYGPIYGHDHTIGDITRFSLDQLKQWLAAGGGKEPVSPDVPDDSSTNEDAGAFRLPDDVIDKLGRGDREAGLMACDELFGHHVSTGRGVVHEVCVNLIGEGNSAVGEKVLQRFCEKIRGAEGGDEYHGGVKVSKAEAGYIPHGSATQRCASCSMFQKPDGCTLVKGEIDPRGWCRYFEPTQ